MTLTLGGGSGLCLSQTAESHLTQALYIHYQGNPFTYADESLRKIFSKPNRFFHHHLSHRFGSDMRTGVWLLWGSETACGMLHMGSQCIRCSQQHTLLHFPLKKHLLTSLFTFTRLNKSMFCYNNPIGARKNDFLAPTWWPPRRGLVSLALGPGIPM